MEGNLVFLCMSLTLEGMYIVAMSTVGTFVDSHVIDIQCGGELAYMCTRTITQYGSTVYIGMAMGGSAL